MRESKLDRKLNERLQRDDEREVKLKQTMHEAKAGREKMRAKNEGGVKENSGPE